MNRQTLIAHAGEAERTPCTNSDEKTCKAGTSSSEWATGLTTRSKARIVKTNIQKSGFKVSHPLFKEHINQTFRLGRLSAAFSGAIFVNIKCFLQRRYERQQNKNVNQKVLKIFPIISITIQTTILTAVLITMQIARITPNPPCQAAVSVHVMFCLA